MLKQLISLVLLAISLSSYAETIELHFDNGWKVEMIDGYYGPNPSISSYGYGGRYGESIGFNYLRELSYEEKIELGIDPSEIVMDSGSNELRFNGATDVGNAVGLVNVDFYRPETNAVSISIFDADWLGYRDREGIYYRIDNFGRETEVYPEAFDLPTVLDSLVGFENYFNYTHSVTVYADVQDPWTPYDDYTDIVSENGRTTLTSWNYQLPPVPLPAAAWLFLSAIGGLGILKRFRKS